MDSMEEKSAGLLSNKYLGNIHAMLRDVIPLTDITLKAQQTVQAWCQISKHQTLKM